MISIKQHLDLLGKKAKDRITGVEGVITSVSFDLYGCVQCTLNRGVDKDGKPYDVFWFDIGRMEVASAKRVMDPPDYDFGPVAEGKKGPAEKPAGKF